MILNSVREKMLIIDTYIDVSPKRGLGLFSKCDVPKGTIYWVRNELFDRVISPENFVLFNKQAKEFIEKYASLEVSGNWYLCVDHARFSNHSENANTKNHFDCQGIVQYSSISVDICRGEEIMINYREICETCRNEIPFDVY